MAQELHMSYQYETCEGTLEGLYLPCLAWSVLRREDIQTIDQLRAVARATAVQTNP